MLYNIILKDVYLIMNNIVKNYMKKFFLKQILMTHMNIIHIMYMVYVINHLLLHHKVKLFHIQNQNLIHLN